MFQYYRFIGQDIASCLYLLEQQSELAGYVLRLVEDEDTAPIQEDIARITVVVESNVITDIFKG
jgi:hypothetical protein